MSESDTNNASEQSEDPIEEVKQDNIKAAKKQKLKADSDKYMGTEWCNLVGILYKSKSFFVS